MPHIMLTTRCQNRCPWCFAQQRMEMYQMQGIHEMGWEHFVTSINFFQEAGRHVVHLLGGEPTLHSRFIDIIHHIHARRMDVYVVTNGILHPALVDSIAASGCSNVQFGFNSSPYSSYRPRKKALVDYFLKATRHKIHLGYIVTETDVVSKDIGPLLSRIAMIREFSLEPHCQLQVAVPSGNNSEYVPLCKYAELVLLLRKWSRVLSDNGISSGLDCHCIPRCAISGDYDETAPVFKSKCSQFMIDIGPDLAVWSCFPFSDSHGKLTRFRDFEEIQSAITQSLKTKVLRYESQCSACKDSKMGACTGGCLGFQHLRKA